MDEEKKYIADNGKTLTAYQYKKGMEDGICKKYNRPYLKKNGGKVYLTEGEYIFVMDGDNEVCVIMSELFEKYTKLLD